MVAVENQLFASIKLGNIIIKSGHYYNIIYVTEIYNNKKTLIDIGALLINIRCVCVSMCACKQDLIYKKKRNQLNATN